MPLHPTRRTAVIDWARRTGGYVLEDDYDGEFRYDRQPVGAVQGLDPERVVYLGSASKSLSPVLRLGWMALPDELVDRVIAAMGGQQFYVNAIDPADDGRLHRKGQLRQAHPPDAATATGAAATAWSSALRPFDVGISGLSAGLHLLLTLPDGTEAEVLRRAGEAGIALSGLALLRHPDAGPDVPPATASWSTSAPPPSTRSAPRSTRCAACSKASTGEAPRAAG